MANHKEPLRGSIVALDPLPLRAHALRPGMTQIGAERYGFVS